MSRFLLYIPFLFHLAPAAPPAFAAEAPRLAARVERRRPVPHNLVELYDEFWAPRIDANHQVTIPFIFQQLAAADSSAKLGKAAGRPPGAPQGGHFSDDQVYQLFEAAANSSVLFRDSRLDGHRNELVAKITAAQARGERFGDARGRLYAAAVAHFRATGRRTLLEVALKDAAALERDFEAGRDTAPSAPPELGGGLLRLYDATSDERYLQLARLCLERLPRPDDWTTSGSARGVVRRAAGLADLAEVSGERDGVQALDRLWENVVGRKLHLTGGLGSRPNGDFGADYELPNRAARAETCGAAALAEWSRRMFLLHGDAQYIDLLERTLYNGFLAGVSLDGRRFFCINPLESDGKTTFNRQRDDIPERRDLEGSATRRPWLPRPCCPLATARLLAAVGGSVYATRGDELYVNLFVNNEAGCLLGDRVITIRQETRYPWDGRVRIQVSASDPEPFTVHVRVPGWARGRPVPGGLYRELDEVAEKYTVKVSGEAIQPRLERGYLRVEVKQDMFGCGIELNLPLAVRRVVSDEKVAANAGKVALERGPLVYCVEGIDCGGRALGLALPDDAPLTAEHRADFLGGVTVLRGRGHAFEEGAGGKPAAAKARDFFAVPYYAWSNRGPGEMAVWLRRAPAR